MDVLWALVFLTMMLRVGKDRQKRNQRKKTKKTQGQTASDKTKEKIYRKKNRKDARIV